MNEKVHPCLKRLDADCFRVYPQWAKQAFAYRLLHLLTPKQLTKRLPKGLRRALLAPGVVVPPGVEVPGGFILGPGAELPSDWVPWGLPEEGVIPPPGALFPPDWTPADPLPPGVILPPGIPLPPDWTPEDPLPPGTTLLPALPPGVEETGPTPPLYIAPGEPGPVHTPVPTPPAGCKSYLDNTRWTATKGSWDNVNKMWLTEEIGGGGNIIHLTELGTWVNGYRPSTFIVTFGGAGTATTYIKDTSVQHITTPSSGVHSGDILTFEWRSNDILYFTLSADDPGWVTNLQFCP